MTRSGRLIAVGLDGTVTDHDEAFREILEQLGEDTSNMRPGPSENRRLLELRELHAKAVRLGLYLREQPLSHAIETLRHMNEEHEDWHILLTDQRFFGKNDAGRYDTGRWLAEYGLNGHDFNATTPTSARMLEIRERAGGDWKWGDDITHASVTDAFYLKADLYIESEPEVCGELLKRNMRVLIRRTSYNGKQCAMAESSAYAAVFDDWFEVPRLAVGLLEENPVTFEAIAKSIGDYLAMTPYVEWDRDTRQLRVGLHELLAYMEATGSHCPIRFCTPYDSTRIKGRRFHDEDDWYYESGELPVDRGRMLDWLNRYSDIRSDYPPLNRILRMADVLHDDYSRVDWVPTLKERDE